MLKFMCDNCGKDLFPYEKNYRNVNIPAETGAEDTNRIELDLCKVCAVRFDDEIRHMVEGYQKARRNALASRTLYEARRG